jgi:hypothetical protein
MSTVTTSNIERSPTFVSKHASAKNQATNPIANAFASLLMAAEEDGSASFTDALDPLATDRATDPRTPDPEVTVALADPGQAALAGLLNWQTLATAGNTAQASASAPQPTTNLAANDGTGLPAAQKDLPLTGKLAVESLPLTTSNALASPPLTPALATAALQPPPSVPTPILAAPALEPSTLRSGATPEATLPPPTVQRQAAEALAAGIEKPTTAKGRSGALRNQLPTSAAGNAGGKAGGPIPMQNNLGAAPASDLGMSPRATVDLAVRTKTETELASIEGDSPRAEAMPFKVEGARPSADSAPHNTDLIQPGEQPAGPTAPADPTVMTGQAADHMTDIMDELSGQIAYWASQGTQRANLTVGDNRDNPLEVSIAMRDGEVHVAFEAAQDDIREALTTNAEAILRNMLESKGMTLGDVTVGQRPPSPDQGAATPQERNGQNPEAAAHLAPNVSAGASRTGQGISAPMLRRPDIATAQKVDLFA